MTEIGIKADESDIHEAALQLNESVTPEAVLNRLIDNLCNPLFFNFFILKSWCVKSTE